MLNYRFFTPKKVFSGGYMPHLPASTPLLKQCGSLIERLNEFRSLSIKYLTFPHFMVRCNVKCSKIFVKVRYDKSFKNAGYQGKSSSNVVRFLIYLKTVFSFRIAKKYMKSKLFQRIKSIFNKCIIISYSCDRGRQQCKSNVQIT